MGVQNEVTRSRVVALIYVVMDIEQARMMFTW